MAMAAFISGPSSSCGNWKSPIKVSAFSSSSDGGLRRPAVKPMAPPKRPDAPPTPSSNPVAPIPTSDSPSTSSSSSSSSSALDIGSGVTLEFQRQRAKELQEYFLDKKFEEAARTGKVFGWIRKNEINNGRWAMFGFSVGLLTEYATGYSFVDQLKLMVSNLGILDLD